jgi:DNA-binding beta-propeller fold protein YncE/mono/diheme cytochrome c family protein
MIRHALLFAACTLAPCILSSAQTPPVGPHKSPLAVWVDDQGQTAYVALHTRNAIAVVDLAAGKVLREINVDAGPVDLAVTDDTVYVACARGDTVVLIDRAKHTVRQRVTVGQEPRALWVDRVKKRIYVICHDEQTLCWWDKETEPVHKVELPGFPLHLGARQGWPAMLIVAQRGGEWLNVLVATDKTPRFYGSDVLQGASNVRGLANLMGTPPFVLAHQRPRNKVAATQVAQGWIFTNALTLSHSPDRILAVALLDEPQRGFADPSAVVRSPDLKRLFVASAGTDTVLAIDTEQLLKHTSKRLEAAGSAGSAEGGYYNNAELPDDLTASRHYVVARLAVQANPRCLALSADGKTLVVGNYLGDSLTVIDAAKLKVIRHISLGGPAPDAARRGEVLFNSARMTFQNQFTCASCHPDGASDGLNWDLPRDGIGNFLNTRSLLGVKDTAPYGWHGTSPTLADRVTGTLRTLQQHAPTDQEVSDLVAYLKTLAPPRPLPQKASAHEATVRGKAIFHGKGQCSSCHKRELLDDERPHDIGTRGPGDVSGIFDTPALVGVARSAPYLHDGRAETLEEIFARHNPEHRHGAAHKLTPAEISDLLTYLRSL